MTVDIDRLVEMTENFDFCNNSLEQMVISTETISRASKKIFEAATKNAVAGLSEQSVFFDQFKTKTEFAQTIAYEIFEAFIELTINFIFYQFLAFAFESTCMQSELCVSASTFQLFKALKISFKLFKVIRTGMNGSYKKAIKLFFKYSSKEIGKSFGKSFFTIPMMGNIAGSFLGGLGQRIFM